MEVAKWIGIGILVIMLIGPLLAALVPEKEWVLPEFWHMPADLTKEDVRWVKAQLELTKDDPGYVALRELERFKDRK